MPVDVFVCRLRGNAFVLIHNKVLSFFFKSLRECGSCYPLVTVHSCLSQMLLVWGDCNRITQEQNSTGYITYTLCKQVFKKTVCTICGGSAWG